MLLTYSRALAPGTYINRQKQAKSYVTFCVCYNVPCLQPSVTAVCMYSQYLANAFQAVSSVKNYLSGARSWICEHGGDPTSFSSIQLDHMIKSFTKHTTHIVKRAFPLLPVHISAICQYLNVSPRTPRCIKACILIGYSCYLRSSNLMLPSFDLLTGAHTLYARDVLVVPQGLKIIINSTKSRSTPYTITVTYNAVAQICPVNAWICYASSRRCNPNRPAFMINDSTPLSPNVVVKIMRDSLQSFNDIDLTSITMHSLRRGAAQAAESNGAPLPDIMKRGGWKTAAGVKPYLTS